MLKGYISRPVKSKGFGKKAKKLWFVLKSDAFVGLKSDTDPTLVEGYSLKRITIQVIEGIPPGGTKKNAGCGFEIKTEGAGSAGAYFVTTSPEEREKWVGAIIAAQDKLNPKQQQQKKPEAIPESIKVAGSEPAPRKTREEGDEKPVAVAPAAGSVSPMASKRSTSETKIDRLEAAAGEAHNTEDDSGGFIVDESASLYDCVCCIDSIDQVVPHGVKTPEGWRVKFAAGMRERFEKGEAKWNSSVVSVLGLYNKGKTFVLNNLTQSQLASGSTVHTEGISFKVIKNRRTNHILLDTAGMHSPVHVRDNHPEIGLAVKKATEFFLEDMTFLLADFFIVVVNDLTSLDQEYIQKLILRLRHDKSKVQQLILMHNFRDARTKENLEVLWKEQVVDIYLSGEIVHDTVSSLDKSTGELVAKQIDWFNTPSSRHLYIANAESAVGKDRGPWVFALLKMWLASMFVPVKREYAAIDRLLEYSNKMIQYYIENSQPVYYDKSKGVILMNIQPEGKKPPALKPATIDVNGFVFVDVDYVPRIDSYIDSEGLHILIDVPGLTGKYKVVKVGWDCIRVSGSRSKPYGDSAQIDKCERKYGSFKKEFKIPSGFQIRGCKHEYNNGVIKIFLSRAAIEEDL